jgi:hypothetical protein
MNRKTVSRLVIELDRNFLEPTEFRLNRFVIKILRRSGQRFHDQLIVVDEI